MADKMQPGRFTLRFNMNDPQQQAAVEILNRMGRQKAQFIAQALTHYAECKCHPQAETQAAWDERALERAILSVLARHPEFMSSGQGDDTAEGQDSLQVEQTEESSSVQNGLMAENSLSAISKTLAAFRNQ